jgi:thiaminase/transcriptional activator TenA
MSGTAEQLWAANADLADQALRHPFVRGIGDGSLPRDAFRGFVAQDAFFLDAFARAYAAALLRSPDTPTMLVFAGLVAGVRDELALHAGYAAEWDVDLTTVDAVPATLAYTEFLLATASTGSLAEICAAMTPCMRLYAHLGRSLADAGVAADNPYRAWVATYADPAFGALADQLETLLDASAAEPSGAVAARYRRAMTLELAFFEASLQGRRAGVTGSARG